MNRNSKPTPVSEVLFKADSTFKSILQHIESINLLQITVSQNLEPELAEHCAVANIRSKTLILATDHANWATRLRYQTSDLLQAIKAKPQLPDITTIRVVVIPNTEIDQPVKTNMASISHKTSAELSTIAAAMIDTEISSCLKRLSKHTKSEPSP